MTPEQKQTLERIIANGYDYSPFQCMEVGWQMYKSKMRDFAWFALFVPFAGSLLTLLGLGGLGMLLLALVISPVLNAGFYMAAHRILSREEEWSFNVFFRALPKARQLILCTLVSSVIMAAILIPMYYLFERAGLTDWYLEVVADPENPPAPPEMNSTESTTFLLNLLPLIYLQVGFSWAFPLILFWDAHPVGALEWSRRLVTKRWGGQFLLLLTFFLLFMLASLLLSPLAAISPGLANLGSFGLFLLFPWAYCSLYLAFRQATTSDQV